MWFKSAVNHPPREVAGISRLIFFPPPGISYIIIPRPRGGGQEKIPGRYDLFSQISPKSHPPPDFFHILDFFHPNFGHPPLFFPTFAFFPRFFFTPTPPISTFPHNKAYTRFFIRIIDLFRPNPEEASRAIVWNLIIAKPLKVTFPRFLVGKTSNLFHSYLQCASI